MAEDTRAPSKTTKKKAKEVSSGLTARCMTVAGQKESNMESANIQVEVEERREGSGKMERGCVGYRSEYI